MGLEVLLDELENLHDKDGNRLGRPMRKANLPTVYYEEMPKIRAVKISRSLRTPNLHIEAGDRSAINKMVREAEALAKSMTRSTEKHRQDELRKALPVRISEFTASLRQAVHAGEIDSQQAALLETKRNLFVDSCVARGLL